MNYCDLFPSYGTQDINVAESMVTCKAIEIVMTNEELAVKIFSDSQIAIDVIETLKINQKRKITRMHTRVYKMCPRRQLPTIDSDPPPVSELEDDVDWDENIPHQNPSTEETHFVAVSESFLLACYTTHHLTKWLSTYFFLSGI